MSTNNPQIEQETIWGYTKEEIERRWKIHQKFDVVNRAFGSSKDPDKKAATPADNSANMLSALERILSPAAEDPEDTIEE